MRMELVENGAIVMNLLQGARPPHPVKLQRAAFDQLIPEVASSFNENELLELLTLVGYLPSADDMVQRAAVGSSLTEDDKRWLRDEWLALNSRSQLLLRFLASHWWIRWFRRRSERSELANEIKRHVAATLRRGPR
jgi:hypothetical protein